MARVLGMSSSKPGRVEVRGDRDGSFFVGCVDNPVEALAASVATARRPMSSTTTKSAEDPGCGPGDGVVGPVRADGGAEVLEGESRDPHPFLDGLLAEGFEEESRSLMARRRRGFLSGGSISGCAGPAG